MSVPEPPESPSTTCFFHTDRVTGRRCTRCGRPACPDCLHDASVGAHCWECIGAAQPSRRERAERSVRNNARDPLLVTKTLIGLNVAMFLVQVVNGSGLGSMFGGGSSVTNFEFKYGLVTQGVAVGEWWRLVTSGFIHFGIMHILFNMLILYRLGMDLEPGIGHTRFATIYTASLLAGSFGMVLLDSGGVGGGASGAVFGVAGAATVALWQRGVRFYNTGWGPLLAINLVLTFTLPNVGVGAHLGGLIAGSILGAVMLHPRRIAASPVVGYVLAAAIIVGSFGGALWVAHAKYPHCTKIAGEIYCPR